MERHLLREGTSSCRISSSWSQRRLTLAPPCKPYRQRRPNASDRLHIPGSTLDSDWTDCLNLTAWFSYHVVSFRLHTCSIGLPRRTAVPLFTNHKVTLNRNCYLQYWLFFKNWLRYWITYQTLMSSETNQSTFFYLIQLLYNQSEYIGIIIAISRPRYTY